MWVSPLFSRVTISKLPNGFLHPTKWMVRIFKAKKCPNCLGRGLCKDGTLCPTCRGEGEIPSALDVVVPEQPCWDTT